MNTETRKDVIVEYPVDFVYDTLLSLFPIKYYELKEYDKVSHSFLVIDSFNSIFIMEIDLDKNTSNTTLIHFYADYPPALMDLTHGGRQAIEIILEELLNKLDEHPRSCSDELLNSEIEVVNKDTFVNTTKNEKHVPTIVLGYILCFLSIAAPLIALINYDPHNDIMAFLFIIGILALSFEISVSVILQYYENSETIIHGRIQLCLCGVSLIILGILIHPGLAVAGICIPVVVLAFLFKRSKSSE